MSTANPPPGRLITLVYGSMKNGKPFWLYAAVKPDAYKAFQEAQKNSAINFQDFDTFGEVIVAGEGQVPPVEVTLKIAEVYQTDPKTFFTGNGSA